MRSMIWSDGMLVWYRGSSKLFYWQISSRWSPTLKRLS